MNKAVGQTLFAQDAKQALAASDHSEEELYLPLTEAQQRLDEAMQRVGELYLAMIDAKPLATARGALSVGLLPLANLVRAKGELQGAQMAKQWGLSVLTSAFDDSLEKASGEFSMDNPEARAVISGHHGSAFPEVIKLAATPGGRQRLRQGQPQPL